MNSKAACLIAWTAARMRAGWFMRCMALAAVSVAAGLRAFGSTGPPPLQSEALLAPTPTAPAAAWPVWWEPDDSRRGTNAALERAYGWESGGAVRAMERILRDELAKPGGGDSNTVARALDAIRQSGDASVTNTLDSLLFSNAAALCPGLLHTRAGFCGLDHWAFARRVVRDMPVKTRRLCYAAAAPLAYVKREGGRIQRHTWQVFMLLQSCAAEETSAPLAVLLDDALSKDTAWRDRNLRKHVAARFKGAFRKPGRHFRQLSEQIGPPAPQPDRTDIMRKLLDIERDGDIPKNYLSGKQKHLNTMFAQDYMIAEKDVVRLLEREFMKTLAERDNPDESSVFRGDALAAIDRCGDPASTNMLLEATLKAEWNPVRIHVFATYVGFMGLDALPAAREVLARQELFLRESRDPYYHVIARLAQGGSATGDSVWVVSAFLKEFLHPGDDSSVSLDSALIATDPDWASSEERKRLAEREVARLANMEKNPISLDKAFSEIDPDWATSEEREKMKGETYIIYGPDGKIDIDPLTAVILGRRPEYWESNKEKKNLVQRETTRWKNTHTLKHFTTVLEAIKKTEETK